MNIFKLLVLFYQSHREAVQFLSTKFVLGVQIPDI